MYSAFLRQDRYKKKKTTTKNTKPRSVSAYSSATSTATCIDFSRPQPLNATDRADRSSLPTATTSYVIPYPLNSPKANISDHLPYSYFRTDQQAKPPAQNVDNHFLNSNYQRYQEFYGRTSPKMTDDGHRLNQKNSSYVNEQLQLVATKYQISSGLVQRLHMLQQFEIVVICDDSSSMNTRINYTRHTRWDELRTFVSIIIDIGALFNRSGVDVHFLNQKPMISIKNPRSIDCVFDRCPAGPTPLVSVLHRIFLSPASNLGRSKRLLVFVATDGEPTDNKGNIDIGSLERLMRKERRSETTHVVFLICTDDKSSVAYLSEWDRTMINVDVIDDYQTEREEVYRIQGRQFPFSFGDYIAKALLGAVDPHMNLLDETIENTHQNKS